jgi:hypothetical protein
VLAERLVADAAVPASRPLDGAKRLRKQVPPPITEHRIVERAFAHEAEPPIGG